jgi:hypothetical protein
MAWCFLRLARERGLRAHFADGVPHRVHDGKRMNHRSFSHGGRDGKTCARKKIEHDDERARETVKHPQSARKYSFRRRDAEPRRQVAARSLANAHVASMTRIRATHVAKRVGHCSTRDHLRRASERGDVHRDRESCATRSMSRVLARSSGPVRRADRFAACGSKRSPIGF